MRSVHPQHVPLHVVISALRGDFEDRVVGGSDRLKLAMGWEVVAGEGGCGGEAVGRMRARFGHA
jgi:hypothetical protein